MHQNPRPRTFAQLSAILDERNALHGILPHHNDAMIDAMVAGQNKKAAQSSLHKDDICNAD